jgi:hypothetical protein
MITVRIALMVLTATVMYPVPGSVSRLGPQLPPQPEHEREPRHAGERCGGDAELGGAYLATSAAPRPPPTGASFGDFGRLERDLLRGGAKKLARSTVVELAVIRYGRTAV